jgi:tRNA threonylcarbamoyladenosine biosynthesis protein TsaE
MTAVVLTERELERWGAAVGGALRPPAFVALRGDLGAGKSVLARAIARGAGVDAPMPSPTFNLLFRYAARGDTDLVHVDLYRLETAAEVAELGWRELPGDHEIVLVEWPERAETLLPKDRWDIRLEPEGTDRRRVSIAACGAAPPLPVPDGDAC